METTSDMDAWVQGHSLEGKPGNRREEDQIRVLLVEDNPSDAHLVRALLEGAERPSVLLTEVAWLKEALVLLQKETFDAVLLDLFLPDARDVKAVEQVHAQAPQIPLVVLTVRDDEHMALESVQMGAQDYLLKSDINPEILIRSLRYAIERHRREQAERALQQGEEYFRALIENGSDIITVVEADGTTRYVSPSMERTLGYRPAERIGRSAFELIHPDDLPEVLSAFQETIQTSELTRTLEYRVRHKEGSWRTLQSTSSNLLGDPAVHGVVVNSHDTTERARAETERERTLSLQRATLEATADGILVVGTTGHVESHNEQFARMWRVPETFLGERNDDELLRCVQGQLKDPEKFLSRVEELYTDPEAESFDIVELADGRVFERYTKPQKIGGETVGRVWSFRDVSERLRLEAQFRQAQKMEAVGKLAGGIAHDFNNILVAIKGTTALLLMDLPPEAPMREDLEEVEHAADRAASLTRQLLAFSRKQILQPEVLDLNALVSRMEQMLRRVIGEQIQIASHLDPALGRVRVDPGQMEQVILNLALNARDAMPEGGTLTLETRNVGPDDPRAGVCAGTPAGCVQLRVRDTGTGMDEGILSRIFEPFFTTKEQGKGTGLGLSAVYGIVQQSGGEVRVESAPGEGSTFTIYLPRIPEQEEVVGSRAGASVRPTGTILLVEDEAPVRRVARRILEREGYRVLEAGDPNEALRIAEAYEGTIHLLLTDVVMPGGSGPELADRLAKLRPEIRVIYMSGYSREAIQTPGVLDSDTVLLQKPFDPAELTRWVSEQLGGR